MGVIKRHQSVAPVKYFDNFISFVAVRLSGYGWQKCDISTEDLFLFKYSVLVTAHFALTRIVFTFLNKNKTFSYLEISLVIVI